MTVTHTKRKATADDTPSDEIGIRYSCDSCYRDISSVVRIQCGECGKLARQSRDAPEAMGGGEEVDLCIDCFGQGVELGQHKKSHVYRVIPPLDFVVYRPDDEPGSEWRADEELLLLEGIEACGLGNWRDIAEQVGSKTPDECWTHYWRVYLDWTGCPLPNPALCSPGLARRKASHPSPAKRPLARQTSRDSTTPTPLQSQPANHEIAGYMPGRHEFETEHENDAETLVKDLYFAPTDSPFDTQLKLTILEIYTATIERRIARKDFVLEHNLVDFKRHLAADKNRSKEERDLYTHLKVFGRFVSRDALQRLLEGLVKEEELRRRIAVLQEYRRNGIRSPDQAALFESEKKHLELYLKGGGTLARTAAALAKEPFALPIATTVPKAASKSDTSLPGTPPAPLSPSPTQPGSRKASMPLNISHADGVELLSEKERNICSILRLYPRLYLTIKDTLIRECLRLGGGLKRAQARAAVKIDVNKTSKLYDFFVAAGWIRPPASGE